MAIYIMLASFTEQGIRKVEAAAAQRLHLLEQRDRGVGDRTLALLRKTSLYGHVCSPILLR